jgi:hypothetical protein
MGTWADAVGGPVTVIACGEKWPDGSLRLSQVQPDQERVGLRQVQPGPRLALHRGTQIGHG